MNDSVSDVQNRELMGRATEVAIRLFLVAALAYWCFLIFKPFLMPLVWGVVIAVALSPLFSWFESLLGGRRKLAGTLFILVGIGVLVVPAYLLSESVFEGVKWLRAQEHKDAIQVPPPPAKVADWPLIGDQVHELWTLASENLEATLRQFGPQVRSFGSCGDSIDVRKASEQLLHVSFESQRYLSVMSAEASGILLDLFLVHFVFLNRWSTTCPSVVYRTWPSATRRSV